MAKIDVLHMNYSKWVKYHVKKIVTSFSLLTCNLKGIVHIISI